MCSTLQKLSSYSKSTRKKILDIINKSNAGHIGASFSVVEILRSVYSSVDVKRSRILPQTVTGSSSVKAMRPRRCIPHYLSLV
ncbi:MAG: hypothetical protein HQL12_01950 [Candidatus Omnitrophica bacterium]|nr:hypothetical protein [Candidatus Omnitrophota bacterium]